MVTFMSVTFEQVPGVTSRNEFAVELSLIAWGTRELATVTGGAGQVSVSPQLSSVPVSLPELSVTDNVQVPAASMPSKADKADIGLKVPLAGHDTGPGASSSKMAKILSSPPHVLSKS
jgi:hypothetical protein